MKADCAFGISTYEQRHVEDNARDRFGPRCDDRAEQRKMVKAKFITYEGDITPHGWDVLNADTDKLENNAMKWLKATFISASDHGHNNDELVGSVEFDTSNENHCYLIELASMSPGRCERIDMCDASYSDLSCSVWTGVSDFGASVLGGQITFTAITPEAWEAIEATRDDCTRADKGSRRGGAR